jgi:hypothetical protein
LSVVMNNFFSSTSGKQVQVTSFLLPLKCALSELKVCNFLIYNTEPTPFASKKLNSDYIHAHKHTPCTQRERERGREREREIFSELC